jgi:hypothetical protein
VLDHLSPGQAAAAFLTLTAVVAAVGGWVKWLRPRFHKIVDEIAKVRDSILGREAVRDSITGAEIAPALPGMGVRMAHQEQQMELLTVTVTKLVDQQMQQQKLEQRVEEHEGRIAKLEADQVERVVARAESAAAFRAIETAIKAAPDVEGDVVEDDPRP